MRWRRHDLRFRPLMVRVRRSTASIGYASTGPLGLAGGSIASDITLGGCRGTQCRITGYWQSDLAVPEPMSAVLLITGLLAAGLASCENAARPAALGSSQLPLP